MMRFSAGNSRARSGSKFQTGPCRSAKFGCRRRPAEKLPAPKPYVNFNMEVWTMSDNSVGSKVSFFLVGLGVGTLLGILFAPKSGEETRDYLASKADEGKEYAQKKARELRERAEEMIERSKEIMSRQKDAMSSAVSGAVEAGKEAYREKVKQ